jgi:hypothetical protein
MSADIFCLVLVAGADENRISEPDRLQVRRVLEVDDDVGAEDQIIDATPYG